MNIDSLREDFRKAFAEYPVELIKDTTITAKKYPHTHYWVAYIKVLQPGIWCFKMDFDYTNDENRKGYLAYTINIGKPGTARSFNTYNSATGAFPGYLQTDAVVGDTVLIPFRLSYSKNFQFSTHKAYDVEEMQSMDSRVNVELENKIEELKYLGTDRYAIPLRSPGTAVHYTAGFEAIAPGQFVIQINDFQPIPVLIVPAHQFIKVLASRSSIMADNSNRPFYVIYTNILRVGDRISMGIGGFQQKAGEHKEFTTQFMVSKKAYSVPDDGLDYLLLE